MKKLGVAGLCVCFVVAFAFAAEKEKGSAPEQDVWKQLNIKVGALIKLSAIFEDPHGKYPYASGSHYGQTDNNYYFKIDHVFINIKGSFAKDFRFFVQPHYSQYLPGGGNIDAANMFIDYVRFPVKIRFGKFKYPGSLGAFTSASKMDFTSRPIMSAETALPQCRDIGLMLFGDVVKAKVANRDLTVRLYASVTNGKRPRDKGWPMGEGMMYTVRAELRLAKLFSLGACYLKDYQEREWGQVPIGAGIDHLRFSSVDATVFFGRIRIGGEFLQGWRVDDDVSCPDIEYDFEGFYVKMFFRFCKYAEIGARYEVWDRNTDDDYETDVLTVGLNVLLNPKRPHAAKIQVNWRKVEEDDPTYKEGNTLQVLLQICF